MLKTGVVLVNLGSPESPQTGDVRKFLRAFLGDPRVVNLPRPLWLLILNLFILPFRPSKSAHAYQSIWTEAGSPLAVHTAGLSQRLNQLYAQPNLEFAYAMSYGEPAIADVIAGLRQNGAGRIIVLPLYPQYSSTTTASVFDALAAYGRKQRHIPELHFISDYHQRPVYIKALADSVRAHWRDHGQAELLLLSFHGLPKKLSELGDPYAKQCAETARLLAAELGLDAARWRLVFQSRFGRAEWLQPYCVETLQALPAEGIKHIDVLCPGFAVDCLETLEEIAITNKQIFLDAGGVEYRYIAALNDGVAHAAAIYDIIINHD